MNKKGQIEFAIMKGLALGLVVIMGFFIYDTFIATTPSGDEIKCKWDCLNVEWSPCIEGYQYRDTSECSVNDDVCHISSPKPVGKINC